MKAFEQKYKTLIFHREDLVNLADSTEGESLDIMFVRDGLSGLRMSLNLETMGLVGFLWVAGGSLSWSFVCFSAASSRSSVVFRIT